MIKHKKNEDAHQSTLAIYKVMDSVNEFLYKDKLYRTIPLTLDML